LQYLSPDWLKKKGQQAGPDLPVVGGAHLRDCLEVDKHCSNLDYLVLRVDLLDIKDENHHTHGVRSSMPYQVMDKETDDKSDADDSHLK
jgi:hypothetical protein